MDYVRMDPDEALVIADRQFAVASDTRNPLDRALFSLAEEVRYFRQRNYDFDNKWDRLGVIIHDLKAIGRIEWNAALNRVLKEMLALDLDPPKQKPIVFGPKSGDIST